MTMRWFRGFLGATLFLFLAVAGHLRVAVRREGLERVKSCQHHFSQVELTNTHPTDNIIIYSIGTTNERVVYAGEVLADPLPQQFHISQLHGALSLAPDQVAIVPVIFLPRFPAKPLKLSTWQRAERPRRDNREGDTPSRREYRVTAQLVIETYQPIDHPLPLLEATAVRTNEYGLPDVIVFDTEQTHVRVVSVDPPQQIEQCYDVYMRHPELVDERLHVTEVLVSRPEEYYLRVEARDGLHTSGVPSQMIRTWTKDGPRDIPNDGESHYIVTVCKGTTDMDPEANDYLEEVGDWLDGHFLLIRTETDTFAVAIEVSEARESHFHEPSKTLLQSEPETLKFNLLYMATEHVSTYVSLTNTGEIPFELVSSSIVLKGGEGVRWTIKQLTTAIMPKTTERQALYIEAVPSWESHLVELPISVHGKVIVRYNNSEILEIPLNITILDGRLGIVLEQSTHMYPYFWDFDHWNDVQIVSGAFFPSSLSDIMFFRQDSDIRDLRAMDHNFIVITNVDLNLTLADVSIVDEEKNQPTEESTCQRLDVSIERDNDMLTMANYTEVGQVHVRYNFPPTNRNRTIEVFPAMCYLRLKFSPDLGFYHYTPLVIYPGLVDISANPYHPGMSKEKSSYTNDESDVAMWNEAIVGFEDMVDWFQTSKAGTALRGLLDPSTDNKKPSERDWILLGRYLYSLARRSMDLENSRLRPVLLKVGAIEHEQTDVLPLYLTNHNPVPTLIMIDVGEVEGMSIAVGRDAASVRGDGNTITDHIPRTIVKNSAKQGQQSAPCVRHGPFEKHPIDGLRRFLLSDELATTFLGQFLYRDAISLSESSVAKMPYLKNLYRNLAFAEFHRTSNSELFASSLSNRCTSDTSYGDFEKAVGSRRMPGPIILSSDSKIMRHLPVCWSREIGPDSLSSDVAEVMVPPGGVARFDIKLRAPSTAVLEKDITEFLATGLVLSTNHNEVMPILVAFEALQGQLDVSHLESGAAKVSLSHDIDRIIRVPALLFVEPAATPELNLWLPRSRFAKDLLRSEIMTHNMTASDDSATLFMKSPFNRDVKLKKISSCNPWFIVKLNSDLRESEWNPFLGINIGSVSSNIACDTTDVFGFNKTFPSFFHCALKLLTQRSIIQPRGCGIRQRNKDRRSSEQDGARIAERSVTDKAAKAFRKALFVMEWSQSISLSRYDTVSREFLEQVAIEKKTGIRSTDGLLPPPYLDSIAAAWDAWNSVAELGLPTLSTSLRAIVEYNSSRLERAVISKRDDIQYNETQLLSLPLRNLTVEMQLAPPMLFDAGKLEELGITSHIGFAGRPSLIEFPSTFVSDTIGLRIPVQNPTSVPVKVCLAVARSSPGMDEQFSSLSPISVDEDARHAFVGSYESVYVQSVVATQDESPRLWMKEDANYQWWSGGSYVLADFYGNLIRSHPTLSIRGMSGAQINLDSTSLRATSAFLNGCGNRCGRRDETPKKYHDIFDPTTSSPIGASAAIGEVLLGRTWSSTTMADDTTFVRDSSIPAGSALFGAPDGPSAFALPYGSTDEVILPPHGNALLGPIYFRPPGRTEKLGCTSISCVSQNFNGMIFIQNTLTGLERVQVKGKAVWEKIVFFTNKIGAELDDFSDIIIKNGYETLLFSGTAAEKKSTELKELILSNEGDVSVIFSGIYFELGTGSRARRSTCSAGRFRLVNCTLSRITLLPGQNVSIFIEYSPNCSKKSEFVTLKFAYDRDLNHNKSYIGTGGWQSGLNRKEYEELKLGFEMNHETYLSCRRTRHVGRRGSFSEKKCYKWFTLAILSVLLAIASRLLPNTADNFVARILSASTLRSDWRLLSFEMDNWPAAFRIIAQSDPSATDLQALGREQTRHDVLTRLKSKGLLSPQCFSASGTFQRERPVSNLNHQNAGGKLVAAGGNERIRTLSDAIFRKYRPVNRNTLWQVPRALGWRTAVTRGILFPAVFREESPSKTETLLAFRSYRLRSPIESSSSQEDSSFRSDLDESGSSNSVTFHASFNELDLCHSDKQGHRDASASDDLSLKEPLFPPSTKASLSKEMQSRQTESTGGNSKIIEAGVNKDHNDSENCTEEEEMSALENKSKHTISPETARPKGTENLGIITTLEKSIADESYAESPVNGSTQFYNQEQKSDLAIATDRSKSGMFEESKRRPIGRSRNDESGKKEAKSSKKAADKKPSRRNREARRTDERYDPSRPTRSPPGIAPPPGFEGTMSSKPTTTSNENQLDLHASDTIPPNPNQQEVHPSRMARNVSNSSSISTNQYKTESSPILRDVGNDSSPLLGNNSGTLMPQRQSLFDQFNDSSAFDVMDFLDGILNDGSTGESNDDMDDSVALTTDLLVSSGLPENPWAADHPRALAYGIAVEDESEQSTHDIGLPLLTPAAILAEERERKKNDKDHASFYPNLR